MPEVLITRDDGELGYIDDTELEAAQESGFRVVDESEAKAIEKRRSAQSTGGMAIGTLEAAARGVSLGTSDAALRALGVDMEAAEARKENLGTFGAGAEIAGAIAPSFFTGGAGAVGAAARLTPAGLAARAGAAAERAVVARGVGGRVAGMAAQGAVEGALGGAGQVVSQQALADQDLDVERAVAGGVEGLGIGAFLGGGLGVAGKGVGYATQGAGKLGKAALEGLAGVGKGADDSLASLGAGGEGRLERAGRWIGRRMSGDEDAYARSFGRLRTPEGRDLILGDLNKTRAQSAKVIKESVDEANAAVDDAVRLSSGANKLRRAEAGLDGIDGATSMPRSVQHLRDTKAQIQAIRDELGDTIPPELRGDLAKFDRFADRAIDDAIKGRSPGEAFIAIDRMKRSMQVVTRERSKHAASVRSPELQETVRRLRDIEGQSLRHLEDDAVYGAAATAQREVNAAASAEFRALDDLKDKSPALAKMLRKGSDVDEATALQLARLASRTGGASKVSALDEALDARLNYLRTVKKFYDLPPEAAKKIDDAERAVEKMRAQLAEQSKVADASADMATLRADEGGGSPSLSVLTTAGSTVGGMVGFSLGGVPGAILGGLAGYATRPFTTVKTAAALLNSFGKFRLGVEGAAAREAGIVANFERLADGGKQVARASSRSARRAAAAQAQDRPPETKTQRTARLLAVRAAVQAAAQDPLQVAEQMQEKVRDLNELAPAIARGLVERSSAAMMFLASKVPDVYESEFGPRGQVVDPAALDRWERYVSAVSDPLGAVEKISRGVLDLEAAETLRTVYPKIYGELQSRVLDMLGRRKAAGKPTSFEGRVQLGLLLDMPLDDSLRPGFLASLPSAQAAPAPGQPAPAPRRSSKPVEIKGRRTELGRLEAGELQR